MRKEEKVINNKNHLPFNLLGVFISLTLFVLLFLPFISAVEVSMNSAFAQGETLLAKFSGNFVDQITDDNVFFYRNHLAIPMIYDVVKINNDFYVYALLQEDQEPGNYSLSIRGVEYYKATQIVDDDIASNFTVTEETAEFSINPGAVFTATDFSVEIQNLLDKSITVIVETDSSIDFQSIINLNTGEKKTVDFNLNENSVRGLADITFSSDNTTYSLPVYLDTNVTEPEEETAKNFKMEFQPRAVEVSLATDSDTKAILYLKNTGEETLEDILFSVSPALEPYIVVSPEKISSLDPGESEQIELQIISDLAEATIEGRVIAYSEDVSAPFTLTLDFVQDFIPAEGETGDEPIILTTCAQLNGTICADNLECSGDTVRAKDGVCCQAPLICEEPKKSSTGKIIGWGLIILVLVIAYWFFRRKYRRVIQRRPF